MTITFALSHQIISRTDSMILASGSKNYVTAQFDLLTEDWTAPITAIFDSYTVVLDDDNQCLVPWEVLANPGKVAVSAFCGDLHTATSVLVPVHPSGYVDGQTPEPPTPDVYAQLVGMVKTAVDTANDVKDRADAGEFNGKDAPQIDDTQASPDHPWSGAKVDAELGKYAPLESALTVSGIGSDMASLSPTIAWKMQGLKLFGRTTQDGTPTPETPNPLVNAGDSGSISPKVCGKNLLHYPYDHTTKTEKGVTFTDNGDGSITIQGTASSDAWFHLMKYDIGKLWWSSKYKLEPYIFSGVPESIRLEYDPIQKLTIITVPSGVSIDATVYPQVEIGTVATAWEPPQKAQIVNVQTPNGFPGIPVDSGGNYTDSTGQQWICDEIDFARGVYVQRVKQVLFDGSDDENWTREATDTEQTVFSNSYTGYSDIINYPLVSSDAAQAMCSHYLVLSANATYLKQTGFSINKYGYILIYDPAYAAGDMAAWKAHLAENPVSVLLVLKTPTETKLSDEEIEAYAALTSYNGTTNVVAQGCGVAAKALANPDEYIKGLIQRIAALEQNAIGG